MLNVALIDDHPIVLAGLVETLRPCAHYEIVGTGSSRDAAMDLVRDGSIDVVILGLTPAVVMNDVIAEIRSEAPATNILVFTGSNDVQNCIGALSAGALGYVLKDIAVPDLFYAIEEVAAGREFIASSMASAVIREMRQAEQRRMANASVSLNSREGQVVRELLNGASNKEIANKLNLSDKTVKHYMTQIMQKFNVRNRVEVVLQAQRIYGKVDGQTRHFA
jgi:two-component system, NarL family, nitrate/nitrite response regulator NarL